ncbi:MAG: DEAD/DEAH box helicase family protein, partial [Methanobrevibacter sp.]|nr:DEAD/DEAH box helicase family protein [Methanobrevibacter sp.]
MQKYSNETCCVLGERITKTGRITYTTVKERVEQLKKPISEFFVITNIESIRDDTVIKAISSGPNKFDMIIVDEIHRCNNKQSQQGANLLKLHALYKVGLSGTLLVNKPLDLYLPLVFTENDHSTLTNFKNQYC